MKVDGGELVEVGDGAAEEGPVGADDGRGLGAGVEADEVGQAGPVPVRHVVAPAAAVLSDEEAGDGAVPEEAQHRLVGRLALHAAAEADHEVPVLRQPLHRRRHRRNLRFL